MTTAQLQQTSNWTLGADPQDDYPLPYTYMMNLPQAGAMPLYRLTGGSLLGLTTLAAVVYAGYQISKQRAQSQGRHTNRSSQAQPIK
ncbi:hypothetical protein KIMH_13150 [Bombiscardovia apis]|uniref:Uncharacterized protein n=1 Tax=Bombiscardovia apis TaxID=2932182 RepID=A0ABM8BE77_9BIFI|nr:hypothetical protein [Bombiscardovia apis]BDR55204.1 hypothetical protein KIMH_13150 [Bombiscardovia apis]